MRKRFLYITIFAIILILLIAAFNIAPIIYEEATKGKVTDVKLNKIDGGSGFGDLSLRRTYDEIAEIIGSKGELVYEGIDYYSQPELKKYIKIYRWEEIHGGYLDVKFDENLISCGQSYSYGSSTRPTYIYW